MRATNKSKFSMKYKWTVVRQFSVSLGTRFTCPFDFNFFFLIFEVADELEL